MRSALLLFFCVGAFAAPAKMIPTAPIQFEKADSQWTARGLGYAFRFEKTGTAMRLGDSAVRMTFENSNPSAPFIGLDHSAHPTNSFRGQTYQRIENFARLRRTGIYPESISFITAATANWNTISKSLPTRTLPHRSLDRRRRQRASQRSWRPDSLARR